MVLPASNSDDVFVKLLSYPPQERLERLDSLTDSEQLRLEVIHLLKAEHAAQQENWLEQSPLSEMLSNADETQTYLKSDTHPVLSTATPKSRDEVPLPKRIGRYEIKRPLGSGAFAIVYLAFDPNFQSEVALKVSRRPIKSDEERARFLKEAQSLFGLNHENIVRVYNAEVSDDGQAFIAMEYVRGKTLFEYLKERRTVDIVEAARIMASVAEAMTVAHRSIVHRDLKPANILVDEQGTPKVSDFGLAIQDDRPHHPGEYAGTTAYMSPEQIRMETDNLHGSSDRWALGVMLYEMLTGQRPFAGRGDALRKAILGKVPKPLREMREEIPVELEEMCLRCLAKDPAARPTSASDIAKSLRRYALGEKPRSALAKPLAIAAAAIVLSTVASIAAVVIIRPWETQKSAKRPDKIAVEDTEPTIREVVWPKGAKVIVTKDGADLQCQQGIGFVTLGSADDDTYALEFEFEQQPFVGKFGIALGYVEPDFHVLMFRILSGRLNIAHSIGKDPLGGLDRVTSEQVDWAPGTTTLRCEMFVHRNRLRRFLVNGQALERIVATPAPIGYRGQFGIRILRNNVRLKSVKLDKRSIPLE